MFGRKTTADLLPLQATRAITAKVMIADDDLNIVYMNDSVMVLMREAEADLRKELPAFSVDKLIGANIDVFHRDPSHQRRMLQALKSVHRATIAIGHRKFDLVATPLRNEKGERTGIVVEWADAATRLQNVDYAGQIAAIGRSQAVIEFSLDGTVLTANENFLATMGYSLGEIAGKNHSMFIPADERDGNADRQFWAALVRGEFQGGEFKRIGKNGKEVWIQATYNPVLDDKGRPAKIVKFAIDVTREKLRNADLAGQIAAIGKSQAVVEFDLDGTIISANENFCRTVGYSLPEFKGKHHSMFVASEERDGAGYREFWAALRRGEYQTGEYRRIGKGGREVWIQASYNPILDLNGRPFKVVKFATDVTRQVLVRLGNERIRNMMETVAAGAEELNASVREISEAMVKSRDTAMGAVERVSSADGHAKRLSDAAESMTGIIELIGHITGQINLLALNATIESARAGEAGRGFAVVASEVKNLANQAKQATDKIGVEIGGLNQISSEVVSALTAIKAEIQNVSEYVNSTAAAVEEQSTVTGEMSSSMQRAAAEAQQLVTQVA